MFNVLMTGGGTGGHVNPALAIANTIKMNIPTAQIAFAGTAHGMENKLVPKEGYPLYHVQVQGIRRSLSLSNIKAFYLALTSPKEAADLLRSVQPDIVIGTGGYVCWPVIKAAHKLGIPTALHESNAIPGATVKQLEKYTDRIFLNFKEAERYLHDKRKLMYVGNPLRTAFQYTEKQQAREMLDVGQYKKIVLSYGGSMGAEHLNHAMLRIMANMATMQPDVLFVHGAGTGRFADMQANFEKMGLDKLENVRISEYIYNMPVMMAAADVVISRSGAMTVSELAMTGKCAILVPSPNVTNNHQFKNAEVLEKAGAAVLIPDDALDGEALEEALGKLLDDASLRRDMEQKIRQFCVEDANRRIFREIMRMTGRQEKE